MKSDAFLQLYRTYESLLREQKGIEPKDEEANVDGLIVSSYLTTWMP